MVEIVPVGVNLRVPRDPRYEPEAEKADRYGTRMYRDNKKNRSVRSDK